VACFPKKKYTNLLQTAWLREEVQGSRESDCCLSFNEIAGLSILGEVDYEAIINIAYSSGDDNRL
jgi:hypothetical protein